MQICNLAPSAHGLMYPRPTAAAAAFIPCVRLLMEQTGTMT